MLSGIHSKISMLAVFLDSDIIGKIVMLSLLSASVWSWAIILQTYYSLKDVLKNMRNFQQEMWCGNSIEDLYDKARIQAVDPSARIFVNSLDEYRKKYHRSNIDDLRDRILQILYKSKIVEMDKLDNNLTILAIIGSTSPFIGLLGTVWGIMNSFQSIAMAKNNSLAVVAPGIAEALLATVIGLFAAIPAVIFYNLFVKKLSLIENRVDDFIAELYLLLSKLHV